MSTTRSSTFNSKPNYERIQVENVTIVEEDGAHTASSLNTISSFLRRRSSIQPIEGFESRRRSSLESVPENNNPRSPKEGSDGSVGLWEYGSVLARHPAYRAYLGSHLCMYLGEHFVRIANVLTVEELTGGSSGAGLAHITIARLLPNAVLALVGGILSDTFDRRRMMITIDVMSGIVVLGYLLAIRFESLPLIYLVTIVRSSLSAIYIPSATGILPDLVQGDQQTRDLQLAVTLNSWAWGGSVIIGGLLAGKIASILGLQACYFIDFATYCTSAILIARGVRADYKTNKETTKSDNGNFDDEEHFVDDDVSIDTHSITKYLAMCGFGWMILAKPSASLVWGIEDIVGAQFATVFKPDGTEDTKLSSIHMGLLFTTIGLGSSIGPMLMNNISDSRKPFTLQRAHWIGLMLLGFGWFVISFVTTFPQFLWATFLRTNGSGICWVYSSLVLQTLCDPRFLGRIMALEHTLTTLFEAATSFVAGTLSTSKGLSDNQLALMGAGLGLFVQISWGIYYSLSLGAAHPRFNRSNITKDRYKRVLASENNSGEETEEKLMIEMGERVPNKLSNDNKTLYKSEGLV